MPVLLIAESSDYLRDALKEAFVNDYEVHTCSDGCTALELLHRLRPDGLIIDLSLVYLDGLTVLQKAQFLPCVIMVLCGTPSSYILHALYEVGVTFVMPVPFLVSAAAARFRELLPVNTLPEVPADRQNMVADHLHLLGIPSHLNGFKMLCLAISLYRQDPLQSLSKETYPAVAELLGNKHEVRTVEHDIRSAIRIGWRHRDPAVWQGYFPHSKPPSNKKFIAAIADRLP